MKKGDGGGTKRAFWRTWTTSDGRDGVEVLFEKVAMVVVGDIDSVYSKKCCAENWVSCGLRRGVVVIFEFRGMDVDEGSCMNFNGSQKYLLAPLLMTMKTEIINPYIKNIFPTYEHLSMSILQ